MADEPEKPDNDDGSSQTPATSEAPEVEAEVVVQGGKEELESGFDDSEGQDNQEGASDDDDGTSPPVRKSTLTPGVILFIVFAIVALLVFAIWRVQSSRPQPSNAPVESVDAVTNSDSEAQDEPAAPAPTFSDNDGAAEDAAPVDDAPDVQESEAADPPFDDASKISNNIADDLKPVEDAADAPALGAPENEPFLPPLPSSENDEGGNLGLQQSAKEAFFSDNPSAEEPESAQDEPEDTAPVFELEDAGEASPAVEETDDLIEEASGVEGDALASVDAEETPAVVIEPIEEVTPQNASAENDAKISNEIASIKEDFREEITGLEQALAAEQERNAMQLAQIETMRRDFQAALTARDERANQEIAALSARLDKIQNDDGLAAGRRAAAAVALSAVQRVAATGQPFENELDNLAGLAPNAGEISVLRRYADQGAPSIGELKQDFAAAARDGLAAAGRDQASGFWGGLKARARSIISIRPAEPTAGDSVRAIISRAESHIENDNIVACITELAALPQSAGDAMGAWLNRAEARAEIDAAIMALNSRLTPSPSR